MEIELNQNDKKLLAYCEDNSRSISEIAKYLEIVPKNVSVRLEKLKRAGLVTIEKRGVGKKTLVRSKKGDKTKEFMLELLKKIDERGGEVTREEYDFLLSSSDWSNIKNLEKSKHYDKLTARWNLLKEKLIDVKYYITEKGKQTLKENKITFS